MTSILFADFVAHPLVHVNATLNAIAAVLLVIGYVLIKQHRVEAHKRAMMAAFVVSIVFLVCYLWYHYQVVHVKFTHPGAVRYVYYVILASHIVLAATVPFLAVAQIYLGYRALGCCLPKDVAGDPVKQMVFTEKDRQKHVRLAWWTFPIWLYVSITGVVVYAMLYHLWPPAGS